MKNKKTVEEITTHATISAPLTFHGPMRTKHLQRAMRAFKLLFGRDAKIQLVRASFTDFSHGYDKACPVSFNYDFAPAHRVPARIVTASHLVLDLGSEGQVEFDPGFCDNLILELV